MIVVLIVFLFWILPVIIQVASWTLLFGLAVALVVGALGVLRSPR